MLAALAQGLPDGGGCEGAHVGRWHTAETVMVTATRAAAVEIDKIILRDCRIGPKGIFSYVHIRELPVSKPLDTGICSFALCKTDEFQSKRENTDTQ